MAQDRVLNILVLSGIFKGERFMRQCRRRGCNVHLLTTDKHLRDPWPLEVLAGVYAQPTRSPLEHTIHTVSYLARTTRFDRIVPMDDYDVETAAALREHLRVPGMGDTTARHFRDKLAMRVKAREEGINVPDFCGVFNYDDLREFMARVPPPWMFKPRGEASASGIKKLHAADELWPLLERLGDRQSYFLMEQFIPGDIYHVDSIISERRVVFAEVHKCGKPPFEVTHGGGVWSTSTVTRGSEEERRLRALNEQVISRLNLLRGVAHTEFIRARDGTLYFMETGARVGGAFIADVVEASSGIDMWAEWADIEVDKGETPYRLPPRREDYAGVAITLARQQWPDLSAYNDPEIVLKPVKEHHAGVVVRAKSAERVRGLLDGYAERFARDFMASAPARETRAD
jgi:biotin carboxylase